MRILLTLIAFLFAACAVILKAVFQVPPIVAAAAFIVAAFVLLVGNRKQIVSALEAFRNGQVKIGVFALLLFSAICTVFAAGNIEDTITSLVIRPSGTRTSDTNGLVRLYSANESNYLAITTNLDFVFSLPNGVFTGLTGVRIFTNEASARVTNGMRSGIVCSTNGVVPQ